ncbi:hypothetical protein GCM10023063_18710 [Arthrobacter methylotrophus]|uniref:Uncharacterized protein n=1 Tax=Arthrobacter methylotrophus TaxID=121291 RepID=A0ABV5URI1_9MICC
MDNYAEFLERIDAAIANLTKRRLILMTAHDVVSSALAHNNSGLTQWAGRQIRLEELLRNGSTANGSGLKDLHEVSLKMASMFRGRAQRVAGRRDAIRARTDDVDRSLQDLRMSKQKLTSSRKLAEERENLSRIVLGLAGTAEGSTTASPDGGLRDDLRAASEAVVLAEALLELKGD